jgi:hypothetical protein
MNNKEEYDEDLLCELDALLDLLKTIVENFKLEESPSAATIKEVLNNLIYIHY